MPAVPFKDVMKHSPIITNLGSDFYDPVEPAAFPKAILRWFNKDAAKTIGLDYLSQVEIKNHFWKFEPFKSNIRQPLALRYHGHQFRHYNQDLGDGRGFLFAQFLGQKKIYDLSTKGSGPTPYSRAGDGKLTLKGALREVLATELLESLGVNTSKTFCVFETGEDLERGDEPSPTRSAVLTRMVHSSLRFGTFQRLDYLEEPKNLEKLVDYALEYYFPEVIVRPGQKIPTFFKTVAKRTADLAAQLMTAGFVHAVLNTDNMNITGEVFDFGPYRFLPKYNPYYTAAYFDRQGLYCYGRQPESFMWGLEQLGLCLKKIEPHLAVEIVLQDYVKEFNIQHKKHLFRRLNLQPLDNELDDTLISQFYQMLSHDQKDFEQGFFDFYGGFDRQGWKVSAKKENYLDSDSLDFISTLKNFKAADASTLLHPYFLERKPETLLIQDIENLWQPIALRDDWSFFEQKITRIQAFRGVYKQAVATKHSEVF